jgi:hypothetical protein
MDQRIYSPKSLGSTINRQRKQKKILQLKKEKIGKWQENYLILYRLFFKFFSSNATNSSDSDLG